MYIDIFAMADKTTVKKFSLQSGGKEQGQDAPADKLSKLYHTMEKLLKHKIEIDPIYIGNNNPNFVDMFLEKNVQLGDQTYISKNIQEIIKKDFTHIYLVGMRMTKDIISGPGRPSNSDSNDAAINVNSKPGLNINIWYFSKGPFMSNDRERVKRIFKRTMVVRSLLGMPDNVRDSLVFYIFPTECVKTLPVKRGMPLGPNECNTGVTLLNKDEIMLWRVEEMDKVLVHELLHHFRVDESLRNLDKNKDNIHFDETYTEWLTTILYTMFETLERPNPSYNRFKHALEDQKQHALKQAAKITYHYKMKNVNNGVFNTVNVPFQQHTHAYEYYVLKAALLLHTDEVIKLVDLKSLQFENSNHFINMVSSCLDEEFISQINQLLHKNVYYDRTLRMVL